MVYISEETAHQKITNCNKIAEFFKIGKLLRIPRSKLKPNKKVQVLEELKQK
jgi:hypothetical protein